MIMFDFMCIRPGSFEPPQFEYYVLSYITQTHLSVLMYNTKMKAGHFDFTVFFLF